MRRSFDAIVIGAGQSGPALAVQLAQSGQNVCLIEREHLGGTCVNDGCMPTKTLVASARVAHLARRASDFGVRVGTDVTIDMKAVKARKDAIVHASRENLAKWLTNTANLELIWGEARFLGPHTVSVNGDMLTAAKIIINTGGRATVPDWPGIKECPYLTNTSILDLDVVPEHLIVVGGSYIGLEFAQIFRRFGARVTVLEYADRPIAREDREVCDAVRDVLEHEGVKFYFSVRDASVLHDGAGIAVHASAEGKPISLRASHLLSAVGRQPNTEALDLPKAGVATDARGFIVVDEALRTNVEGIWATGDVNGQGAFTHTSYNDYEIIADHLLGEARRSVNDRIPVYALFTDPPLARIGLNDSQARARGRSTLKGVMPMARVGRAKERDETTGFMQVLVDQETSQIVGATLFCVEGDEIIHLLLDIMYAKAPYRVIQRAVHIHPTISELIPTLLGDLKPLA